ncbi:MULTISPECIES: hypothetical protein [Acidovorax]|uniref:Uncharacterized protein n=1 Tax=Acidovorax facilis TaxID=12917 RepID=A0ABV8DC90_9BURK|nr:MULTISPECIES: hypothetical protein [Acidovorax]MBO1010622.1 hypothetical protein [Acidovorax sp. SD340]MCO4244134.1 hypothetical protein [Acidovorax facilis]
MSFKDIASGVYFTELKLPADGIIDSVEVVVDSNMLRAVRQSPALFKRLGWILGPGTVMHVNVAYFAFEQFIGNQSSALHRLRDFTEHQALMGSFPVGFAESFLNNLPTHESDIRRLIGTLAIYLFVLRSLFEQKIPMEDKTRKWRELFHSDVPKLSVVYVLGLLFFHGQENSRLTFTVSDRKVQAWAEHYLSVRGEEIGDPPRWARNRLFDLIPLYSAPALNIQALGGKPGRLLTATQDTYAAECLYRLFAFYGEQQADEPWHVIINFDCLKPKSDPLFEQLRSEFLSIRAMQTVEHRKTRVRNLIDASLPLLSPDRKADLLRTLDEFAIWSWLGKASNCEPFQASEPNS